MPRPAHRFPMISVLMRCLLAVIALAVALGPRAHAQSAAEWTAYGHDAFGTRFSPLARISRQNVVRLVPAWTFRTREMDSVPQQPRFEATPLMVDGTLYLSTPFGRVFALDPTTGRQRWMYDAHADRRGDWGDFANRGVATWVDASVPATTSCHRRIYLGTIDGRIIALDARSGALCRGFGEHGTHESLDVSRASAQQLRNFGGPAVSQAYPHYFRRKSAQEAALAKVIILGDDQQVVARGASPYRLVVARLQTQIAHVRRPRKEVSQVARQPRRKVLVEQEPRRHAGNRIYAAGSVMSRRSRSAAKA